MDAIFHVLFQKKNNMALNKKRNLFAIFNYQVDDAQLELL